MAKKRKAQNRLFGTKQVAELLNIPEWRVKNFSEGEAYNLSPSRQVGTGRGSRRLYSEGDVYRLVIANHLLNCGFAPVAVGRAVREIPESKLMELEGELAEDLPVLVCEGGKWRVRTSEQARDYLADHLALGFPAERGGIFVLNYPGLLQDVFFRMDPNL